MDRESEPLETDVIDLGSVVDETKGGTQGLEDHPGLRIQFGISDVD